MKNLKFTLVILMVVFMMGCNRKEEIEIYDKKMPIYNINNELSILELDEIYQIYEYGFGGTKLFEYLKKNNICNYRMISEDQTFYYTCLHVKDTGFLYIFLEYNESEYSVSHLVLKDDNSICTKEDFEKLIIQAGTINDVIKIDKNTEYNTLYTNYVGTITMHFLSDGSILRLYYSKDSLNKIMYIKYENKENTIEYIQNINDIDWA